MNRLKNQCSPLLSTMYVLLMMLLFLLFMRDGSFNCMSSSLLSEGPFLPCFPDREDFIENLMKIEVKELNQDVKKDYRE